MKQPNSQVELGITGSEKNSVGPNGEFTVMVCGKVNSVFTPESNAALSTVNLIEHIQAAQIFLSQE